MKRDGHITMKEIRSIARRIAEKFDVEKIILFGSYAYGTPTEGSDVDLLIIMNHQKISNREQRHEIAHLLYPRQFPLDLIVRTPKDIRTRIPQGDWFLKDAVGLGKVIYDRSAA